MNYFSRFLLIIILVNIAPIVPMEQKNYKRCRIKYYNRDWSDETLILFAILNNDPIELETTIKCARLKKKDIKSILHNDYYFYTESLAEQAFKKHGERAKEFIDIFIKHGFDINALNQNGETRLHCAIKYENTTVDGIKFLVEQLGAKFTNQPPYDVTPMHLAVKSDSVEKVQYLFDKGFGFNAYTTDYRCATPFHYAKSPKMVEYLLKLGVNINIQSKNENTLLRETDDLEIIKCLIKHKGDPNLIGLGCKTPLQNQIENKSFYNVQYLIDNGAAIDTTDEAILHHKTNNFPEYQGFYVDGPEKSFDIILYNNVNADIFRLLLSLGMKTNARWTADELEKKLKNKVLSFSEVTTLAIEAIKWDTDNSWKQKYINNIEDNDNQTMLNKLCFFKRSCFLNDIKAIQVFIKNYENINNQFSWEEAALYAARYNKNSVHTFRLLSQLKLSKEDLTSFYSTKPDDTALTELYKIAKEANNKEFCRDIWSYVLISKRLSFFMDIVHHISAYHKIEKFIFEGQM